MSVTVSFYDHRHKTKVKNSLAFPEDPSQLWEFSSAQDVYLPNKLMVNVSDGANYLELRLFAGYLRCCGMREFGEVNFSYKCPPETKQAQVKQLFEHPWFKQQRIGALLYTKVKNPSDDPEYSDGWDFVRCWPGTVTEGGWWYNPNSGNYCCNVTLSFDAEKATEEEEDW